MNDTPSTSVADPFGPACIYGNIRSDDPADMREATCFPISHDITTKLSLDVPHYHGPGTYTFEGSTSMTIPGLAMTVSDKSVNSVPGSPGIPATQCTLVVTGPDTIHQGSFVTGHIRCTDMSAVSRLGSAGAARAETVIVEGSFSVEVTTIITI